MPPRTRFTIYDALDAKGYFAQNPANPGATDPTDGSALYKGPVPFPAMLYHPLGEERVIVPGETIVDPLRGPMIVGQIREIINTIVANEAEQKKMLAEGWHTHPAKAVKARIMEQIKANPKMSAQEKSKLLAAVPVMSSDDKIKQLEAELARLQGLQESEGEAA